ncbi:GNAT family N-acetyltransferase [candidate division GN15 bacterium]|nr:GNAT family N-acetyltransferase [candidate division GN15 bacterium]
MLATVVDAGKLILAALMTPPHKLQLTLFDAGSSAAIELLAGELHRNGWQVPGVMGEEAAAKTFAEHWSSLTGVVAHRGMRQRIYELREVNPIHYPEGDIRPAPPDDLDLVIKWSHAFHTDCFGDTEHPELDDSQTAGMVEKGNLFLWVDSEPVSMAALTRPTAHGISVSFVYTPPALRGRGYASAVVARLSQRCLDSGREFCSLFTDLSNSTSNSIYQRIGYNPVADVTELILGDVKDM